MKTILLVDDDPQLLEREARTFGRLPTQFRLLTADNGHDALKVLETRVVDLLITDLQMPLMDGFELLSRALVHQPNLALLVMSEIATDSLEMALETPGTAEVLRKPIESGLLLERCRVIFARRTRGHLSGISLSGFLQLLHLERRSCALTLRSQEKTGTIELFDGELISATCGPRRGSEAMYEILSWHQPDIEMVGTFARSHRDIDMSLEGVLLDAARRTDEANREQALRNQWIDSSRESGDAIPPLQLSNKQREKVQALLYRLMVLDGALGAALIDTRTGLCLASESRRLQADLEESAGQLATLVRARRHLLTPEAGQDEVERLVIRRREEIEIFGLFHDAPLAIYFLSHTRDCDESEALASIERISLKIRDTLAKRTSTVTPFSGLRRSSENDDSSEVQLGPDSVVEEEDPIPPLPARQG